MKEAVLEFINRRFGATNANWKSGNCYYFALILADRFGGNLYYDVINGHFLCKIDDYFFDYDGIYQPDEKDYLVEWNKFDEYDSIQKERIIKDVIL